MPNHDNGLKVTNFDSGVVIALGDGHDDRVDDHGSSNTISFGNGDGDKFFAVQDSTGDTVTLGDGNHDTAIDDGGLGGNTFILGNGNSDSVIEFDQALHSTVTLGNGDHDYVALISFGFHLGQTDVTFGGPQAELDLGGAQGPSFLTPTTRDQTSIDTSGLDVISGLVQGDHIDLWRGSANIPTLATAANLAGVNGGAVLATGTYNASAHSFTQSATGHDALLTESTGFPGFVRFVSVVLVGAASDVAGSFLHHGVITLG